MKQLAYSARALQDLEDYLIFFRYDQDAVQIIRIIERHRDTAGPFEPEEE